MAGGDAWVTDDGLSVSEATWGGPSRLSFPKKLYKK